VSGAESPTPPAAAAEPLLRIRNADVTPREVAAILAVLAAGGSGAGGSAGGSASGSGAAGAARAGDAGPSSVWRRGVGLRGIRAGAGPLEPGPDGWRTSAWPR